MKNLLIILSIFAGQLVHASQDRHVIIDTVCNCSVARFQTVIDKFFYEFQADSKALFDWAYLNTSGDGDTSNEGKDAVAIKYGLNTYDSITKTADQALDIYVLGSKMFPDRHLGTVNHGTYMTATYSGSMLQGADFTFVMDSIAPTQTRVHCEFNFVLGKFLSWFITEKKWKTVADWRFRQVFANLVEYAETGNVTDKRKK